MNDARGVDGKHAGRFYNLFLGYPCDLFDPGRRILLDPFLKLVKPMGPICDEFFVVKVFVDNDMHHPEGKRRIGPGPYLKPQIGLVGNRCRTGVNQY